MLGTTSFLVLVVAVMCGSSYANRGLIIHPGKEVCLPLNWPVDDQNTTQYLEWRHGPDLLASWTSGNSNFVKKERRDVLINDQFELCLLRTSVEDSGVYTAFIDSVQTQRIKIFILSPVPVPTVSWDCEDPVAGTPEVLCLVTCEGNTSGAEPVLYRWHSHHRNISNDFTDLKVTGLNSTLQLIVADGPDDPLELSCIMRNAINEERSPPSSRYSTPTQRETLHPLQGVIVFASFVLAVGVAVVAHRCWTGVWFFRQEPMPWQSDFWRRKGRSEAEALAHVSVVDSSVASGEPENVQPKDPEQLGEVRL